MLQPVVQQANCDRLMSQQKNSRGPERVQTAKACALAASSGLLLFASDWPLRLIYLHYFALVPLFYALNIPGRRTGFEWRVAICFALCYALPSIYFAATLAPVWLAAGIGVLQWCLVVSLLGYCARCSWWLGSIASAALICLVELFAWHAIPVFGAAQCFARVTSATPMLVQFAAFGGLISVVFILVLTQALLAHVCLPQQKLRKLVALASVLMAVAGLNWIRWTRPLGPTVKVAATSGWMYPGMQSVQGALDQAQAAGACILVTPEMGLFGDEGVRQMVIAAVQANGLHAAIGIFRQDLNRNQILFVSPDGQVQDYSKSHLIPLLEDYVAGESAITTLQWCGVQCGGVICQDDNFSDLARGHSRAGTQLMLVPTMDWQPIAGYHLDSSVMRSLECGYAIVRGAIGGFAAIVSPRGEILESRNDANDVALGPQAPTCIVADLMVGNAQPTLYARLGDWPVFIISCLVLTAAIVRWPPNTGLANGARTN